MAQYRVLAVLITARPQAAGSLTGGWKTLLMQDLRAWRCGVSSSPHDLAAVLPH
jgi:hypothetical protein